MDAYQEATGEILDSTKAESMLRKMSNAEDEQKKHNLKEGYYIKDGIHLSKAGNEVIMKYFENHMYNK